MKRLLGAVLVLLVLAVTTNVLSQEHAKDGQQDHGNTATQQQTHEPSTMGGQLAEASNEAAGQRHEEGGGHSELKQSAAVKGIAKITGLSVERAYLVSIILNFVILAGLIVLISRSKLPAAFRTRTDTIQRGIREAQKASEDANRRLAEIESRLARLDSEVASMRAAAEAEGAIEEERIRQSTEAEKQKIVQSAEADIAAAAKIARRELKTYTAELAVSLAEKRIHVDAETDHALVSNFVAQLGTDKDGQ